MITLLMEWSIRAILMAVGTATVLRLLRIRSAAARHTAWTAVLAVMLLMPAWTAWGPKLVLPVLPKAEQAAFEPSLGAGIPLVSSPPATSTTIPSSQPIDTQRPTPEPAPTLPWGSVVLVCYFTGAGVMLARLIAGTVRARSLIRRATPEDGIFTSSDCSAPVTVGWLRPVILLPLNWRSWPSAELDAVLIHEREHVRRRDSLTQGLALLNRAIFWFHPLAWWLERKLAELAEDACDAVVLQQGHDPRLYSEYLIGLARDVERAGARLPALGTGIGGAGLASRIQRILARSHQHQISRGRAVVAAALCGAALATFGACSLGRTQKPAPGQLSMNEMANREYAEQLKREAENKASFDEAKNFTPEQAANKLASLKANPDDNRAYIQLMRYYQFHSDLKGKDALTLWYIEHAPDTMHVWPGNIDPELDRAAYDQGKRLWLANTKKPGAKAEIYQRAGSFLKGPDMPLAEEILLAGRAAYPEDLLLARLLGQHYASALRGSGDPQTEYKVVPSPGEARGPYAQSARTKLERSTDSQILAQTAQWLAAWGRGRDGRLATDTLALAQSLASRAVMLDPANQAAILTEFRVRHTKEMEKLRDLRDLPAEQRAQLGDADRLLLVRYEMAQAWSPAGRTPDFDQTTAKARELLDLAQRVPNDPHGGYAIFEANIMLGKIALRQGNRTESARYLLAAAEAPASEDLRYDTILMNLPRALIDWGEREAVAQFFERLAPKTIRTKEFQDWAAQIRKGENPEMMGPTMGGCAQAPC